MEGFPTLRRKLEFLFSVQVGLSEERRKILLVESLTKIEGNAIRTELIEAFSSKDTPWIDLIYNSEYEVFEPDSEEEAKEFIYENLWTPAFPDTLRPSPN